MALPSATKKRLVQLEAVLKSWEGEKITSKKISGLTGWSESTIRHDLWLIGKTHGISDGYSTSSLLATLENCLGNDPVGVCIVGLGRLGAALLDDTFFEGSRFVIKAGFDSNVNRVEILRSTFPLYPAGEMALVVKREKIRLAVLTVADKDAQTMAQRLVTSGITGIVNMTRAVLKVPDNVRVENLSVIGALSLLD